MGWVALSLRKQTLKAGIAEEQLRLLQLSREVRSVQRELSTEKSIYQIDKDEELRDAREEFNKVKEARVSTDDPGYGDWRNEYDIAQQEYQEQKLDINEYYDDIFTELEEEAQDKQTALEDEQASVEAQMQAMQAELESVSEQISTDIKNSAIKFQ